MRNFLRHVVTGLTERYIGIEAYNDGLDPVKSFMRWERELPQFIRKLRNQHVHFAQTIRILLEPIADEFELAALLQEPNGQLWKGDKMALRLSERLGDSYIAYQSTMGDIERITKKIASKLDLDRAAEVCDATRLAVSSPCLPTELAYPERTRSNVGSQPQERK